MDKLELKTIVEEAVTVYNHYRSPKAFARVIDLSTRKVKIAFSGPFCFGCGVQDYPEDFVYDFQRTSEKAKLVIVQVRQVNERGFEVVYVVKLA